MKYTYKIRKDGYINKWYADRFEYGVIVTRYDFNTYIEAAHAVNCWMSRDHR